MAIVTGGSRGLGRAICERLASEGADVVLNYVSPSSDAESAARDIANRYGVQVLPHLADVSREDEVTAMFSRVESVFGAAHILVNNAGICPVKMIADTSYEEWRRVMDINVGGVFLTCRAFLKSRMASGGGRIVNIASQSAYNGSKNGKTHYAASKGAVVSFTISFAKEAAAFKVAVNAVSPGMMLTDMTKGMLSSPDARERYAASIPIGRLAKTEEVARAVAYLCSDASEYMTGSILDISGGLCGR